MNKSNLFGLGGGLVAFGILIIILPMFGRQFLVVSLLSGGAWLGFTLIGIGVAIMFFLWPKN